MEIGRKSIETAVRKYNISDCPGHQKYATVMINNTLLADYAIVIVSAKENEFMAGFCADDDGEGSTRNHFKILKASNCKRILVVVNKMDAKGIEWSQSIFEERVTYV